MFNWLRQKISNTTSKLSQPASWFVDWATGGKSASGVTVTPSTAIQLAAVYACVDRLSSGVASLPCILYQRDGSERSRATAHPLYRLLHDQANDWQTAFEFWQWAMIVLLLRGNSYAFIDRRRGVILQIIPINTDHITPLVEDSGLYRLVGYCYQPPGRESVTFLPNEIMHIRGMPTSTPLIGTSVISAQREPLGAAIAAESQAAAQFSNGSKLSGIVKVPVELKPDQKEILRNEWQKVYGGSSNAHKVAVLGADADFKPISMTAEDAQLLESRKLSRSLIAGMFNTPAHMINDLEKATFSNVEHQDIAFAKHTLRPWLVRIEQAIKRDLLTASEKLTYFAEFLTEGLMRGDFKSLMEGLNLQINAGMLSPNEGRQKLNMNNRAGGDVYLTPLNMRESGPDASRPDEAAAQNLLSESAKRLTSRITGNSLRAARAAHKNNSFDALSATLEKSETEFIEILGNVLALIAPTADVDSLAQGFREGLIGSLSEIPVDDPKFLDLFELRLSRWQLSATSKLSEIPLC